MAIKIKHINLKRKRDLWDESHTFLDTTIFTGVGLNAKRKGKDQVLVDTVLVN